MHPTIQDYLLSAKDGLRRVMGNVMLPDLPLRMVDGEVGNVI